MTTLSNLSPDSLTRASTQPITTYSQAKDLHNELHRTSSHPSEPQEKRHSTSSEIVDPLAAARLAALASPCFFHRRIDDAVDIEKVLEEIARDESMSHSRLVQTATGVREVAKQLQRRPMRRAVKTITIVTKARDNSLVVLTRALADWLIRTPRYGSSAGVTVYVDAKLRGSKRFDNAGLPAQEPRFEQMLKYWTPDLCWTSPEMFDLVLTLGGDGTVLFTSWMFQRIVPPVMSFSLGSLGFLTPFDFESYHEHLDHIMGGTTPDSQRNLSPTNTISALSLDYSGSARPPAKTGSTGSSTPSTSDIIHDAGMRVNLRMRFTCTVYRANPRRRRPSHHLTHKRLPVSTDENNNNSNIGPTHTESSTFEVLNELVIDRGPSPYVSNLELYSGADNALLTVIQADGVIFSTPTGSTAYSLSAGGALVQPDIPAILLTPICPHTLSFRPMLLNDTMALRVAVPRGSRATARCSFDGKGRAELRQGDFVAVAASRYPFPVVEGGRGRDRWIDSVSRTLRWNTRGARQKGWHDGAAATAATPGATQATGPGTAVDAFDTIGEEYYDDLDSAAGEEEEFDIDFDEDDEVGDSKDSGYGGEGSGLGLATGGRATPVRRATVDGVVVAGST